MTYHRIRDLREDADLTQKQLAEKLYMHLTQYRRYETGESELPMNIAVTLADFYNVSLDYIAGRSVYADGGDDSCLSSDESKLMDIYRILSERRKGKLELYAQLLLQEENGLSRTLV